MQEHDLSWVRTEMALAQDAPRSHVGPGAWARKNLFATPVDSALSVLALLAIAWFLPQILTGIGSMIAFFFLQRRAEKREARGEVAPA